MIRRLFILLWLAADAAGAGDGPLGDRLGRDFSSALKAPAYAGVTVGVAVSDASSGKQIFGLNERRRMVTASVTKIVTACAVLKKFGPDRKFATPVCSTAQLRNSVLDGDLFFTGRGDPSLTLGDLESCAKALRQKGLRTVRGGLTYDTTFLEEEQSRYGQNARNLYSPACGLTADYGWIDVLIGDGPPVSLKLVPESGYAKLSFKVELSASMVPGRPALLLVRKPGGDDFSVNGTISSWDRKYHYVWLGVSRPGLYAATLFREACLRNGITFASGIRQGRTPPAAAALAEMKGRTVGSMVKSMNRESNNVIAETLGKDLSAVGGAAGTREGGLAVMRDFLVREAGFRKENFTLSDASGLSDKNSFTASDLTRLLDRVQKDKSIAHAFMESLAPQGHHPHAMNPVPPEGISVLVKTGTLSVQGVNTIAGYVIVKKTGRVFSFAILANRDKPGPMTYSGTLTNPLLKILLDAVDQVD